jgi:hypothetical protein
MYLYYFQCRELFVYAMHLHDLICCNYVQRERKLCNSSSKAAIPLQALTGPEGSRRLGSQILRQSAHEGGKGVSPTHRPPVPQEIFLVLISVRGWVDPRAIVRPEGLRQWKNPVTSSGIEPVTFQFVEKWLNHYATSSSSRNSLSDGKQDSCWLRL